MKDIPYDTIINEVIDEIKKKFTENKTKSFDRSERIEYILKNIPYFKLFKSINLESLDNMFYIVKKYYEVPDNSSYMLECWLKFLTSFLSFSILSDKISKVNETINILNMYFKKNEDNLRQDREFKKIVTDFTNQLQLSMKSIDKNSMNGENFKKLEGDF